MVEGRVVDMCEVILENDSSNDKVLQNFIETYEALPELWNTSHPSYMNKAKRNIALDKLTSIYKNMKPGANRADVRRKINTLRSNYRKQLKKIELSMRTESGTDEVYQPTSWVFHALKFLHNCEQPVDANVHYIKILHDDEEQSFVSSQAPEKDLTELFNAPPPVVSIPSIITSPPPAKKPRVIEQLPKRNEVCNCVGKSKVSQDPEPTVLKVWGEKLMALDAQQRLFAEKAINDVLFEASLGSLNRHSVKINEDPYQHSFVKITT